MTLKQNFAPRATNAIRIALGTSGVIALIAGLIIVIWPDKSAMAIAAVFAVYILLSGLIYAASGIFSKYIGGWARVGHIILGVLLVIAGIVMFSSLGMTAASLGILLRILVGITWIFEGFAAFSTTPRTRSKFWPVLFGVFSILSGIILLLSPLFAGLFSFWMLGITLVIQGIINTVRSFTFHSSQARIDF